MKLHIKNFRSIKQLDLELAPITVLYGHNGTGKSSALYAPLTMKNIVDNPNQHPDEFFNYKFARLGEFREVIFDHNPINDLELGISLQVGIDDSDELDYKITIRHDNGGTFQLKVFSSTKLKDHLSIPISFPYGMGNYERFESLGVGEFLWDGINVSIDDSSLASSHQDAPSPENEILRYPMETLNKVKFVPLGRGFFQPSYSMGIVSPMAVTEQEITSLLASDEYLEYTISPHMEQILDRDFRIRGGIGTNSFALACIDKQSKMGATLVNEGFGVNQMVYLLANVLHRDAGIVCIEEPEIHLHPTAIRRLVHALAEIVGESGDKHLIISTHSEQFIMSLLALVAGGSYSPDDLAIYLVSKEGKASEFQRQQVSENGQIEDGLASFLEGELEDMKVFLGVEVG